MECGISGNRVIDVKIVPVEGVTSEDAPEGKPAALQGAVLFDCLKRVLRAGGNKAAAGRARGRDVPAVKPDGREHEFFHPSSLISPSFRQAAR